MSQRVRIGMIGGGQGAFIGAVHRIALRMDDAFDLVAGCFGGIQKTQRSPVPSSGSIHLAATTVGNR